MKIVLPKIGTEAHREVKFTQQINVLNDIVRYKIGVSDIHGLL